MDAAEAVAAGLPVFDDRSLVPRDMRTRSELEERGLTRLGEACALLRGADGLEALFSTSEARRLRGDLWPRAQAGAGAASTAARAERSAGERLAATPRPHGRPGGLSYPTFTGRPQGRGRACGTDPHGWLTELFREGFVVLDTETTGLSTQAEIIEIGLVDSEGEALLETKVWPHADHVPSAATRVHGFTIADLHGAPTWPDVMLELERHLEGRRVLAWNAPFDERMVAQSARRWRLHAGPTGFECAMRAYSSVRGVPGSLRLERAAQIEGVLALARAQSHTSLADARLTLAVLQRLRRTPSSLA